MCNKIFSGVIKKLEATKKVKKGTSLNEKILDPVGGVLRCWLDTSFFYHLPDDDLNQLNKRSL